MSKSKKQIERIYETFKIYRPTPINMFEGDLSTLDLWFDQWLKFFFDTKVTIKSKKGEETKQVFDMLLPISKKKYKDITEEEEAVSIPLSTMCQGNAFFLSEMMPPGFSKIF